jgi:L,D-transpeptidase YcbB
LSRKLIAGAVAALGVSLWAVEPVPLDRDVAEAAAEFVKQLRAGGLDAAKAGWIAGIEHHRRIVEAGGWQPIGEGPKIDPDAEDERVPALRARLAWTEEFVPPAADGRPLHYDADLVEAVCAFQRAHGLKPDGIVGVRTLAALNESAASRLGRLLVNAERALREGAAPADGIRVNVPDFRLTVREGGEEVLVMRVQVGSRFRPTPLFTSRVNQITLNPMWTVPRSLAKYDILPKLQRGPDQMLEKGFIAFRGPWNDPEEVDLLSVDWTTVRRENLRYWFRQKPGPQNALGRMRFNVPNRDDIYLHDTPEQQLFRVDRRDRSSGCIRLEKPFELALHLLSGNRGWDGEKLRESVDSGETAVLYLAQPRSITFDYTTAWFDDGRLQIREDIYNHDAREAQVLIHRLLE